MFMFGMFLFLNVLINPTVHLCSLCLPSPFEHISHFADKSPEKKEEIVMSPTSLVPLHAKRRTTLRPLNEAIRRALSRRQKVYLSNVFVFKCLNQSMYISVPLSTESV